MNPFKRRSQSGEEGICPVRTRWGRSSDADVRTVQTARTVFRCGCC